MAHTTVTCTGGQQEGDRRMGEAGGRRPEGGGVKDGRPWLTGGWQGGH